MKKLIVLSLLLFVATLQAQAESLRWDHVSLYYLSTDVTTRGGEKATGFGFQATKTIGEDVFLFGNFERTHDYYAEYIATSFGLGYRYYAAKNTALWAGASSVEIEIDRNDRLYYRSEKATGYGLQAGIRSLVAKDIEVSASLSYVDIEDESQSAASVSAQYYFSENFSGIIGLKKAEDSTTKVFSLNYYF
jgi:hypothetical protein